MNQKRLKIEKERRNTLIHRGKRGVLHYENFSFIDRVADFFFKTTGLWKLGNKNAKKLKTNFVSLEFDRLPEAFDKSKILFISDIHISSLDNTNKIIELIDGLDYDYCILGGDYCHGVGENLDLVKQRMSELSKHLLNKSKVFAILGNHDTTELAEYLSSIGIDLLVNDSAILERDNQKIALVGLDDCHYYQSHDFDTAEENIPEDIFKILLCHSPETYKQAHIRNYDLYLAGHTHGGQICLPFGIALVTNASVPRKMIRGIWKHKSLKGFTSTGAGAAKVPVRFFCPPEICIITLQKG